MLSEQLNSLSGTDFEELCAMLISGLGFQVEMTKASGDDGIDIVANNTMPLYRGKYIIQCKRYTNTVGEPVLRDLYGVVMSERANKGILMTTGTFTRNAIAFAEGKPLELIDISGIQDLITRSGCEFSVFSSGINSSKIESILEKGLNHYTYCDLQAELTAAPSNLCIHGKLGLFLFEAATDSLNFSDYSIDERRTLLFACLYYLNPFKKRNIDDLKDKTLKMQTFICLWCCAQSSFLLGKHAEAEQYYQRALSWDELLNSTIKENHLISCLYSLVVDLIAFYSTTGQYEKAKHFLQHPVYKLMLQEKRQLYYLILNKLLMCNGQHIGENCFLIWTIF